MPHQLPRIQFKKIVIATVSAFAVIPTINIYAQSSGDIGFADASVCLPDTIDIPLAIKESEKGNPDELPTNIEADEIESGADNVITLSGNAQVVQGKRGIFADVITYNQDSYKATAEGNVKFYTPNGSVLSAESMQLEVDTFIGSAGNVEFKVAESSPNIAYREHNNYVEDYSILAPYRNRSKATVESNDEIDENKYVRARGTADSVEFEGKDYELFYNTSMTTCAEGNDDVMLMAKEIELDHVNGTGRAKSMKVKFKNIPIFYFPTVTFPITDARKTGFLFPGIGYEDESGMILEAPYYINIAPNRDATVIPRVLSERGVQLYGEYRYLTENSDGILKAEILPSDDVFGDDRHAFSLQHDQDFGKRWDANIDLQDVSDTDYLRDFANDVDVTSSTFVPQRARLNYRGKNINLRAKLSAFEPVNQSISLSSRPYEELPEISLDLKKQSLGAFKFGIDSEFTDFQHDDNELVSGTRLRVKPYVILPLEKIYGYVKPKFSLQSISYSLDNNPTGDTSPSASIPIFSVDSGLFFDRAFERNGNPFLQTLEPRLFYVNIPDEIEQEAFPDFDSGGGSNSSFGHFFRENRFFGGDRVGDTHQISLGLTSRIINDDTGDQRLKLSLGQIFFIDDREVGLTLDSDAEN